MKDDVPLSPRPLFHPSSFLLHPCRLVDLARFERATSTFAESRSDSPELQVRELAEAAGLEPAHAVRGDLANRCHTIRRRLHRLAEGTGLEPASDKCAVVFGTTALPVRLPFQDIFDFRLMCSQR